jgi:hypothetical protein
VSSYGGSLGGGSSLGCGRLLLHLPVTLPQVKHFDVSRWVDFVNGISGSSAGFSIQIVALNEHAVIRQAAQPNVSFSSQIQLYSFANMQTKEKSDDEI